MSTQCAPPFHTHPHTHTHPCAPPPPHTQGHNAASDASHHVKRQTHATCLSRRLPPMLSHKEPTRSLLATSRAHLLHTPTFLPLRDAQAPHHTRAACRSLSRPHATRSVSPTPFEMAARCGWDCWWPPTQRNPCVQNDQPLVSMRRATPPEQGRVQEIATRPQACPRFGPWWQTAAAQTDKQTDGCGKQQTASPLCRSESLARQVCAGDCMAAAQHNQHRQHGRDRRRL